MRHHERVSDWLETDWLKPAELDALVRGYSDKQLAEHYQSAAKQPGTEWHRLLSDEIGRRDGGGR